MLLHELESQPPPAQLQVSVGPVSLNRDAQEEMCISQVMCVKHRDEHIDDGLDLCLDASHDEDVIHMDQQPGSA